MIDHLERPVAEPSTRYLRVKHGIDFVMALLMLIALFPALLLIALAVRLDSPGPAIYRQKRMGRFGKQFTMWKFRTMRVGTPILSTADMERQQLSPYTRLGRVLRRLSLDELPQLVNILRGEMSFIGPRPALPSQEDVNALRTQEGADRVRPGITGLAQVMGRDDLPVDIKVGYDAGYCRSLSFCQDVRVLGLTVLVVLSGRGSK